MPSLAALLEYLQLQVQLGVPSLYYSTHIDTTGEPLTQDAYRAIRSACRAYAQAEGGGSLVGQEEGGIAEG